MKNVITVSLIFILIVMISTPSYAHFPSFNPVYRQASPSIVSIEAAKSPHSLTYGFNKSYANPSTDHASGVIMTHDGYIVTNFHVVKDKNKFLVRLNNGKLTAATLIGKDKYTDLALLKIDLTRLPTLNIGNSSMISVGDWVVAIGNPFGFSGSLTSGVISAVGRSDTDKRNVSDLIQTDVPINPGNSGGALLNSKGELIGINSAIFSNNGAYNGISFSIPINMVNRVVSDLTTYGEVRRGWLGVEIKSLDNKYRLSTSYEYQYGVIVTHVSEISNAFKSGLRIGDIIMSINNYQILSPESLVYRVAELQINDRVDLKYFRNNEIKPLSFLLNKPPNRF